MASRASLSPTEERTGIWPDETLLSFDHQAILEAATARILPSDQDPGARETKVMDYIADALRDPMHRSFLPLLRRGLDFIQDFAEERSQKAFVDCEPDEQDAVLKEVQLFPNNASRRFFDTMIELTLEGFLCDPSRGGNAHQLGWEHVGFQLDQPEACG